MKVLVAVDKSPESHMALAYTCHLLEHFDADVHALHVMPDEVEMTAEGFYAPFFGKDALNEWIDAEALKIEQDVHKTCETCLAGKVPCEPELVSGDPAEEILEAAGSGGFDLLVLGSHGRSSLKGFLLGTVHAKVLHHSSLPVLIVRDFREIRRVLVAYRGSQCDRNALKFIGPLLSRTKPQIVVLHVQEDGREDGERFSEQCVLEAGLTLEELGHAPIVKKVKGDFVDEILKEVARSRHDLVVLGAYGHTKPKYLRLISDEALNLVRLCNRPVLVYRDRNSD